MVFRVFLDRFFGFYDRDISFPELVVREIVSVSVES